MDAYDEARRLHDRVNQYAALVGRLSAVLIYMTDITPEQQVERCRAMLADFEDQR